MEVQEAVVEQIVPADTSTSGDFGEGIGEMEEELLAKLNEPETPEADATDSTVSKTETVKVEPVLADAPTIEINKSLSFKAGIAPTVDQIKALEKEFERAGYREADYTKKTQEIAEVRRQAEEVLQAQQAISQDPRLLRNYFEPKQILAAFTPQEMLNYGLAASKVSPQVWNQFLEWHKEAGFPTEGAPTADPYVEQFTSFEQRLAKQDQVIQQFQQEKAQREAMEVQNRQQEAYNKEVVRIEGDMKQALGQYPDVKGRRLVVEMAASDGTQTWAQLAKQIHDERETDKTAWVDRKQLTKQNTTKPSKGQPVNIMPRQPKTFDEADALIEQVHGGRPNYR
jgi:hypothetical protein